MRKVITLICSHCNQEFQGKPNFPSRRTRFRFCSAEHQKAFFDAPLITRRCKNCQSFFQIKEHIIRQKTAEYCSKSCWLIYARTDDFYRERLLKLIKIMPNGCWEWQKGRDKGYGLFSIRGKQFGAHRASAMLLKGCDIKGKAVLHDCDNPPCINPAHLTVGTQQENRADCVKKNRHIKGEQCPKAKLTAEKVKAIRKDKRVHEQIAKEYGITRQTVHRIQYFLSWRHVPIE